MLRPSFTDWLYQAPFPLQTQGNESRYPVTCFVSVLTGTRGEGNEGEAPHLLIIDQPLPLPFPKIAAQLIGYFHINPKDPAHIILLHTRAEGGLLRDIFVQCTPEWELRNDGTWEIPQPAWSGKRRWSEQRVSVEKEALYTSLLRAPVRLTLHLGDPLPGGGPLTYGEVRDGVRLVWNDRGACLLLPGKEAPDYVTITGEYVPCFATPHDAFRFLQESQHLIFPTRALSQSIVSLVATPIKAGRTLTEAEETPVPPLQEQNNGEDLSFIEAAPPQKKETEEAPGRPQENTSMGSGRHPRGRKRASQGAE